VKIKRSILIFSFICCLTTTLFSQVEEIIKSKDSIIVLDKKINPLAPSTAAFYSAILPGLGQAYNKKYWKIPVVYAALGTSTFFYIDNNKKVQPIQRCFSIIGIRKAA